MLPRRMERLRYQSLTGLIKTDRGFSSTATDDSTTNQQPDNPFLGLFRCFEIVSPESLFFWRTFPWTKLDKHGSLDIKQRRKKNVRLP